MSCAQGNEPFAKRVFPDSPPLQPLMMRVRLVLLVLVVACLASVDARQKTKVGKVHRRDRPGITTDLFGGGKKSGDRSDSGSRPQRQTQPVKSSYGNDNEKTGKVQGTTRPLKM